jgi:hypothetical protein
MNTPARQCYRESDAPIYAPVRIDELTGIALDWAVGICTNEFFMRKTPYTPGDPTKPSQWLEFPTYARPDGGRYSNKKWRVYSPSTDASIGEALLKKYKIAPIAEAADPHAADGPTRLVAGMRCLVHLLRARHQGPDDNTILVPVVLVQHAPV